MTHDEKISWMANWCAKHGIALKLQGECGFGRECVGIMSDGKYPDYYWHDEKTWDRLDNNGEVWTPKDAYHKHPCVAVLGRGVDAESQLYDWLKWFDENGFVIESDMNLNPNMDIMSIIVGHHITVRMVRNILDKNVIME